MMSVKTRAVISADYCELRWTLWRYRDSACTDSASPDSVCTDAELQRVSAKIDRYAGRCW